MATNSLSDQKKLLKEITDLTNDFQKGLLASDDAIDKMEASMNSFTDETKKAGKTVKKSLIKQFESVKSLVEDVQKQMADKGLDKQSERITGIFRDQFDSLTSYIDKLPLGDKLKTLMGVEDISKQFETRIKGAFEKTLKEGPIQWKLFFDAGSQALKSLGGGITKYLLSPIGAVLALVVLTTKRFTETDSVLRSINDNTGFTLNNMNKIGDVARATHRDIAGIGATLEESAEATNVLLDTFGSLDYVTRDNTDNIIRMTKGIGLSADESAKVLGLFADMTGDTGKLATDAIATTQKLAEMNGVAPKAVFQDIASASDRIFSVMNGMPETIAKTAVQARLLGINLDTAANISEGLLDFESSIENQMNAMVLTGRNINLEQARYYSAIGETDKALTEVSKQIGTVEELNSMLPFQQKAMAQAIGVSVGELRKMARQQELSAKLAAGTYNAYDELSKGASLSEVLGANKIQTPLENMMNSFNEIVVALSDIFYPIFQILAVTLLPLIAGLFKGIAAVVKPMVSFIENIFKSIGLNGEVVTKIFQEIGYWLGYVGTLVALVAGAISGSILSIGGVIMWLGGIIWEFIVKPFEDAWDYLFGHTVWSSETISEVFSGILDTLRVVGNAIVDILILPFEIVWERVKAIFSGIGELVGDAVSFVTDLFGGGGPEVAPVIAGGGIPASQAAIITAGAKPAATAGGQATEQKTLNDVVNRLDMLIEALSSGVNLKMQGAKVGEILAKDARKP